METIKEILIRRDGMSPEEADEMIESAKEDAIFLIDEGDLEGAYNICQTYFGLEPDYLDEILPI